MVSNHSARARALRLSRFLADQAQYLRDAVTLNSDDTPVDGDLLTTYTTDVIDNVAAIIDHNRTRIREEQEEIDA